MGEGLKPNRAQKGIATLPLKMAPGTGAHGRLQTGYPFYRATEHREHTEIQRESPPSSNASIRIGHLNHTATTPKINAAGDSEREIILGISPTSD